MRENRLQVQCSAVLWKYFMKARQAWQCKEKLQVNNIFASAKARQNAQPSLWQCSGNTCWKWTITLPSQGQVIRPARPMALHCRETTCNETFQAPRPRLGLSPGLAYGTALCENNLQGNILRAWAKAKLVARPGLWRCTTGKQSIRKQFFRLWCNLWRFQPTLFPILSLLSGVQISRGAYKERKCMDY